MEMNLLITTGKNKVVKNAFKKHIELEEEIKK